MNTARRWRPTPVVRGLTAAALCLLGVSATAQAPPDIDTLLARVSERIADYYKRAQSVVCLEKTTVLPIANGLNPAGFARITESELRVESDVDNDGDGSAASASFVRQVVKINGRPPREKDKKDRAACTDPNPLSAEPLAFLLPANREGYTFKTSGLGKGKDRSAFIIDFTAESEDREGKVVEDERGVEGCFNISIPAPVRGRIWVDAITYQVLRLERHLAGLGDIRVSFAQQRKHSLPNYMTIERYDTAIRYRSIRFTDPDEAMLLPELIETVVIWRNGMESTRRRQEYSDYRRFLTAGRIVK
jgi:hypothetical protein